MLPFPVMFEYGNIVIPALTETIFSLNTFNSTTDIRDKGKYSIPINVYGGLPVGTDQYGTYINFTGNTSQWIDFASPYLDLGEAEIYMLMSGFTYRPGQYGTTILDSRPYSTNGPYITMGYSSTQPAPFNIDVTYNSTQTTSSSAITSYPVELKLQIRRTGTKMYINGVLDKESSYTINVVNQQFKIARNAFISTAVVPYFNGKLYSFEIRKFLT